MNEEIEQVVRTAQNLANRLNKVMYVFYDSTLECYAIEDSDKYALTSLETVHPVGEEDE